MTTTMRPQGGSMLDTLPEDYVLVDVETTGRSFYYCKIIEVGAVKVVGGRVTDRFQRFIHIDEALTSFITELTGITDEMLATAPDEAEVMEEFDKFAGDAVLVAHNANFDMTFLYLAYVRSLGRPLTNDFVDTLRVARRALPELDHHRAEDLCLELGVTNECPHRGLSDAEAEQRCYEIMRRMLIDRYGEEGVARVFARRTARKTNAADIVAQSEPDVDNPLYGMKVSFTGTMASMVRNDAMQALKNIGGEPQDRVRRDTDYLVVGNDGFQKSLQGPSAKLKKAQQNELKGLTIKIISEDAFLEMLLS